MAKLADQLGKYLVEWPDGIDFIEQSLSHELWRVRGIRVTSLNCYIHELADDWRTAKVTKSQYLAARDRIATNMQATKEAREIAQGRELPKPDRKLWKSAALAAFAGYCARPGMDAECAAEEAMYAADAFMNAMEKHLKGGV